MRTVVDSHSGYDKGTGVGDTESLSRRVDNFNILECARNFYPRLSVLATFQGIYVTRHMYVLHHGAWLCCTSV